MANLLQLKINVVISHLEPYCTYNWCAKTACCSSGLIFTFLYIHNSIQTASEQFISCIHLSLYTSLFIQPHKQKSDGVTSGDSNSSVPIKKTPP